MATKPEDRKPHTQKQLFDRMDGEAQRERSDHFRAMTQGRNRPMQYGTGKPENIPKQKKGKK